MRLYNAKHSNQKRNTINKRNESRCKIDPNRYTSLWKAAAVGSGVEFEKYMDDFHKIGPDAFRWLMNEMEPCHWVDCYFEGRSYGHCTSNIVEATNTWLLDGGTVSWRKPAPSPQAGPVRLY